MEMGDQYGLPDLRRFLARRAHFPANPQTSDPYFAHTHRNNIPPLPPPYHEAAAAATFMVSNGMAIPSSLVRFGHDHFTASSTAIPASFPSSASASLFGVEMESGGWSFGTMDVGNSRWPRQETLTLLEIRSRLDSKFKEANQKGPLWDEVSRIMAEEHGYQRSGKKCREKFENLYKYYKKTKEGKAGRQDGKNYRFFRQLEALYGETANQSSIPETQRTLLRQAPNYDTMNQENNHQETLQEQKLMSESLSFSNNASEFETSSSENNDDQDLSAIAFMMKQSMVEKQQQQKASESGSSKKGWKTKVKDFVESQMKKLIDSQDAWMEKMLKTIEDKEHERLSKEEEWRRQESARFDKEHEFWAKERAWVEARDIALMEALKKCATGKGLEVSSSAATTTETHSHNRWTEHEISSLVQIRTSLEPRFQDCGYSKESLWEKIVAEMVSLGYEREAIECKEKWDNLQMYFNMTTECYKKRKEDFCRMGSNNNNINYFQPIDSCDQAQENNNSNNNHNIARQRDSHSPSNSYVGTQQLLDTNSFQIGVNPGDQSLWDRYGLNLKPSKGKNKQI